MHYTHMCIHYTYTYTRTHVYMYLHAHTKRGVRNEQTNWQTDGRTDRWTEWRPDAMFDENTRQADDGRGYKHA